MMRKMAESPLMEYRFKPKGQCITGVTFYTNSSIVSTRHSLASFFDSLLILTITITSMYHLLMFLFTICRYTIILNITTTS